MAQKVVIDLEVNTDKGIKDVKKLQNSFDSLEDSVDKVSDASDKTKKSIDDVASNGGAIAILDQLTGGLATQFKNAYESTRLFNFSLKGTKNALIASGIGALVVALGTVIAYWDDIVNYISGANDELKKQEQLQKNINRELERRGELQKDNIRLQKIQEEEQVLRAKIKGATEEEITAIRQKGFLDRIAIAEKEAQEANKILENSSTADEETFNKAQEAQIKAFRELGIRRAELQKFLLEQQLPNEEKKTNGEEKTNREKQKADDLEKIRKALIDTEDERRKEELRKIKADYDEKIKLAEKYYGEESQQALDLINAKKIAIDNQQQKFDEEDKKKKEEKELQEKAKIQELNDLKNQIRDAEAVTEEERRALEIEKTTEHYDKLIELARAKGLATEGLEIAKENALLENKIAISEQERELDKQKIKDKSMVVDAISQFADAETGIGKALLIAKQALALKETLIDIKRITFKGTQAVAEAGVNSAQNISESSKIGFPQNLITIAGAIAQGISIIGSVKKAVSKTKASVGGMSVSSPSIATPSASSQPPAFNVVGASDTNQLADAIGSQSQEPVKAYVVANDVTTAQSMDRNIVDGASI